MRFTCNDCGDQFDARLMDTDERVCYDCLEKEEEHMDDSVPCFDSKGQDYGPPYSMANPTGYIKRSKNGKGISIEDYYPNPVSEDSLIEMYEFLLETGKIEENGPAHKRLKKLKKAQIRRRSWSGRKDI
jgi:hypothetical protein